MRRVFTIIFLGLGVAAPGRAWAASKILAAGETLTLTDSFAGRVVEENTCLEVSRRSDASRVVVLEQLPDGPTLGVPIVVNAQAVGALMLVRAMGAESYSNSDRMFAVTLAEQVAIAFEFERARGDRERMMLIDDRERIARDLHDLVIQRLFGAGISLQSACPRSKSRSPSGGSMTRSTNLTRRFARSAIPSLR